MDNSARPVYDIAAIQLMNAKPNAMGKMIRCCDVGFDCDGVIKAQTTEEALKQAAAHAKAAHGIDEVTPEIVEKIKAVMQDTA